MRDLCNSLHQEGSLSMNAQGMQEEPLLTVMLFFLGGLLRFDCPSSNIRCVFTGTSRSKLPKAQQLTEWFFVFFRAWNRVHGPAICGRRVPIGGDPFRGKPQHIFLRQMPISSDRNARKLSAYFLLLWNVFGHMECLLNCSCFLADMSFTHVL